jgi:hypothetical protein
VLPHDAHQGRMPRHSARHTLRPACQVTLLVDLPRVGPLLPDAARAVSGPCGGTQRRPTPTTTNSQVAGQSVDRLSGRRSQTRPFTSSATDPRRNRWAPARHHEGVTVPFVNNHGVPETGMEPWPCCHHMTLTHRGGFEMCEVCGWEDDGQGDHDADVIRGVPTAR